jgi:ubiquinone/menaquinone biosynthesis C-methylase UbiE
VKSVKCSKSSLPVSNLEKKTIKLNDQKKLEMNTQSIQPHNNKAAATWSAGGYNYDRISQFISGAIEHCITRLAPESGEQILDVATGTGWAARLLANKESKVTGLDIATGLIEAARIIASKAQMEIDFQVGDADALPFANDSFDAVVSTFGVMFSSRPEDAAGELARVCKKGGRIGLTTWLPDSNIFGIFSVMKPYQPVSSNPAPPSPFAWGTKERVSELLNSSFNLKFETGTVFLRVTSGLAAWKLFVESYGPTKILAASLDEERFNAFKLDFVTFLEKFKTDLGVEMPCKYLVTIGIRR